VGGDRAVRLGEQRLTAIEERIEVVLALGGHAEAAAALAGLVREHPLRERFRGQLMLALYKCGRRAEALAAFAETRSVLVEDLGIEPGSELRSLHERILAADAALDQPAGGAVTRPEPSSAAGQASGRPVPAQLPGDVDAFTGRAAELAELDRMLATAHGQPGQGAAEASAVVISAVSGTAGVGKTALAVHWARRVAAVFPDGQLYVNLRGYDPDQPVRPADALAGFLRALGMAEEDIPPEPEERAAAYRSLLHGRRTLVVLDNAGGVEQVRPLLPGSPGCLVVVTSRDSLAGLVARHGVQRLDLDTLPLRDAAALLRALIGARVDAEPSATATLAAQCARLPLALRVAAELAAARPDDSLHDLAGQLADERRRLDLLDAGGDVRTAVRGVFSWSYRHLGDDAARAFRLLGLHPGADFDAHAAAALAATTLEQARDFLHLLARAHLVRPVSRSRYGMHDLLRAYARQLASAEDRQAALTSLFDYYLGTAAAAMDTLVPGERHHRPAIPATVTPVPVLTSRARARGWLDEQRATFVAIAAYTAEHDWPGHTTGLAATVYRYLETGGHYADAAAIHSHARRAARRAGDRAAEATALTNLGIVSWRQGRYRQAAGQHRQALTVSVAIGDRTGEAIALNNLGAVYERQGRYEEAAGRHREALALFREMGDRAGESEALNGVGETLLATGRPAEARVQHAAALALASQIGDTYEHARAHSGLAAACHASGDASLAQCHRRRALDFYAALGAPQPSVEMPARVTVLSRESLRDHRDLVGRAAAGTA
jgi:tetratricopeptide (TPR) repeat protein